MARRIRWQIALALLGILAIIGLVGTTALTTANQALPITGNAYVEGVIGRATQLNPLLQTPESPQSERDLAALLFDGLTRSGPDGQPLPALAERWSISASSTVYTFTLHADLRWHDAVPLTADDVSWTIQRIQNADFPGDPALADFWRNVLVKQLDDRRIEFTLRAPFAPFLAATNLPILPRHLLEAVPLNQWAVAPFSRAPIGSGPYRLEQLTATEAILRPFEGAVRGRPTIDLVILRFFGQLGDATDALRRRDIQALAAVTQPGEPQIPLARGLVATSASLDQYTILTFNLQVSPLSDLELRRALAAGLDRDRLISQVLAGNARRLDTPILPDAWAAEPTVRLPAFDPTAAQRRLDALGWQRGPDGIRSRNDAPLQLSLMVANTPPQRALAAEIARQWQELGIQVEPEIVPASELAGRLATHSFTMALHSWSDLGSDPDLYGLWHSSQVDTGANYAGLQDDQLSQLLADGRSTTNQIERKRIYAEAQRRWTALIPSLPLFQPRLVLVHDGNLAPVGLDDRLLHGSADRFQTISGWTMTTRP